MGVITKVTCASCGTEWQCHTGCGIMHGDLAQVADLYPDDIRNKIMAFAEENPFPWFDFKFQLSCCGHCGSIESVPLLMLGEGRTVFAGTCKQCGEPTQLIRNIKKAQCPICHKKTLSAEETGFWD